MSEQKKIVAAVIEVVVWFSSAVHFVSRSTRAHLLFPSVFCVCVRCHIIFSFR